MSKTEWIPVTERVPDQLGAFPVYYKQRGFALWSPWRKKWTGLDGRPVVVTHWIDWREWPEPMEE